MWTIPRGREHLKNLVEECTERAREIFHLEERTTGEKTVEIIGEKENTESRSWPK